MLAIVPLFVLLRNYEQPLALRAVLGTARRVWLPLTTAVICALPIYVYAEYSLANGTNVSELGYVLDTIFQGKTRYERAAEAWPALLRQIDVTRGRWPLAGGYLIFAVALFAFVDPWGRRLLLCVAIPFTILWATSFSYDARNLALAMPFWGLCFGIGLATVATWLDVLIVSFAKKTLPKTAPFAIASRYGVVAVTLVVAAVAITANARKWTESRLLNRQARLEREQFGGNPEIAAELIRSVASLQRPYGIITNWRFTCLFSWVQDATSCLLYWSWEGKLTQIQQQIAAKPDIDWLAVVSEPSLSPELAGLLKDQAFRLSATAEGGERMLFFVRQKEAQTAPSAEAPGAS
jgi:hypothetical protein